MSRYYVEVPFLGKLSMEVEATSKEEAGQLVFDATVDARMEVPEGIHMDVEWDAYLDVEEVLQECYGVTSKIHVEELEDE